MKLNRGKNPVPQLFTGNLIKSVLTPNPGTCWPIMDCNYFTAAAKKKPDVRVLQRWPCLHIVNFNCVHKANRARRDSNTSHGQVVMLLISVSIGLKQNPGKKILEGSIAHADIFPSLSLPSISLSLHLSGRLCPDDQEITF